VRRQLPAGDGTLVVGECENAAQATDAIGKLNPDVILLDIEMPRMDGYELATQVRADPRTHDVPVIMITSRMGEKHRARAMALGVDDYLGKPYQEGQLLDAMQPLLARRFEALGLPAPTLGA
jgi:chemosensory pili system protein ChpA (sensor histidine kinase/response regulator)